MSADRKLAYAAYDTGIVRAYDIMSSKVVFGASCVNNRHRNRLAGGNCDEESGRLALAWPFSQPLILGLPAEESSDARVLCIATHPSQSIIALGKNDHTVAFYNIETGE